MNAYVVQCNGNLPNLSKFKQMKQSQKLQCNGELNPVLQFKSLEPLPQYFRSYL